MCKLPSPLFFCKSPFPGITSKAKKPSQATTLKVQLFAHRLIHIGCWTMQDFKPVAQTYEIGKELNDFFYRSPEIEEALDDHRL